MSCEPGGGFEAVYGRVASDWEQVARRIQDDWDVFLEDVERNIAQALRNLAGARSKTAQGFNIFEITGHAHLEVETHSRFLAHLLDPSETHGQGGLFLGGFLSRLRGNTAVPRPDGYWWVAAEYSTDFGRLDILLRHRHEPFFVVIENKIYASDQPGQLVRYWQWLCEQGPGGQKHLVYLTPAGTEPTELSFDHPSASPKMKREARARVQCMSYRGDLAPQWNGLINEIACPEVKAVVRQYIRTIGDL